MLLLTKTKRAANLWAIISSFKLIINTWHWYLWDKRIDRRCPCGVWRLDQQLDRSISLRGLWSPVGSLDVYVCPLATIPPLRSVNCSGTWTHVHNTLELSVQGWLKQNSRILCRLPLLSYNSIRSLSHIANPPLTLPHGYVLQSTHVALLSIINQIQWADYRADLVETLPLDIGQGRLWFLLGAFAINALLCCSVGTYKGKTTYEISEKEILVQK